MRGPARQGKPTSADGHPSSSRPPHPGAPVPGQPPAPQRTARAANRGSRPARSPPAPPQRGSEPQPATAASLLNFHVVTTSASGQRRLLCTRVCCRHCKAGPTYNGGSARTGADQRLLRTVTCSKARRRACRLGAGPARPGSAAYGTQNFWFCLRLVHGLPSLRRWGGFSHEWAGPPGAGSRAKEVPRGGRPRGPGGARHGLARQARPRGRPAVPPWPWLRRRPGQPPPLMAAVICAWPLGSVW